MSSHHPDTSTAYLAVLDDVWSRYSHRSAPRGLAVRERLNYVFTVDNPSDGPITTKDAARNEVIRRYVEKEFKLYRDKTNLVEAFIEASKFWKKIANPDGTINSAYGYLIWGCRSYGNAMYEPGPGNFRSPWDWCVKRLTEDSQTRHAVLHFARPDHYWSGNRDQVCTLAGQFQIREGRLHLTVTMRSNDVVKGLVYDMPWFCSLISEMITSLRPVYPDLRPGTYTHVANNLHVYESDEKVVLSMLGQGEAAG